MRIAVRIVLPLLLASLLGGCVVVPAYRDSGRGYYYGTNGGYASGAVIYGNVSPYYVPWGYGYGYGYGYRGGYYRDWHGDRDRDRGRHDYRHDRRAYSTYRPTHGYHHGGTRARVVRGARRPESAGHGGWSAPPVRSDRGSGSAWRKYRHGSRKR